MTDDNVNTRCMKAGIEAYLEAARARTDEQPSFLFTEMTPKAMFAL